MSTRYVRADEPDGPVYYVLESTFPDGPGLWRVVRDDTRNGGKCRRLEITPEQWHRELLDGVFVPLEPEE